MAASSTPTSFWATYGLGYPGAAGANIAEDALAKATMIDPEDHAALTMLPTTNAIDFLKHEWFTDALAAISTAGSVEGADFLADTLSARTRLQNYVQRFRKDIGVTKDTLIASQRGSVYGSNGNEFGLQKGKAAMEILRNTDARLLSSGTTAECGPASGTTAVASQLGNLRYWANASGVSTAVNSAFATASFYALAKTMWRQGAKADTLIVGGGVKGDISRTLLSDSALALVQNNTAVTGETYSPVVEIIRTDYGRVACVVDRWAPESNTTAASGTVQGAYFLLERSKVRVAYWRTLEQNDLEPNGDSVRAYLISALSLEVLHPSCVGMGYGVLST